MSWKSFKEEAERLTGGQKLFILCAMVCGFCITADYGIVRPVSHSVFLSRYGSQFFPYVWLAIVPFNFLVIEFYNRFLPKIGIKKMFYVILGSIITGNCCAAFFMDKVPFFPFIFYIWKEIYVMLLFQQLWSVVHSTIRMEQAKLLYGLLFAFGGIGGIVGSILPGYFAVQVGSTNLLVGSLPLLFILGVSFYFLLKQSLLEKASLEKPQITNFWQGVVAIRNSKYLLFILAIVVLMQMTTTIIYYQFNISLEHSILEQDLRTQFCGRVLGIANILTVVLQLFGSFLFVQFLGLKRSHLAMPLMLAMNALGSLVFPSFTMISAAFITIKAFDFSLFGVLKEMLYIPLKREEKFQAKAIIDVFAYRSSKAVASCLILVLQIAGFSQMVTTLSWSSLILLITWSWIVYQMFQLKTSPELSNSIEK